MDANPTVQTILNDFAKHFSPALRASSAYQALEQFLFATDAEYVNAFLDIKLVEAHSKLGPGEPLHIGDDLTAHPVFAPVIWILEGLDSVDSRNHPLRSIVEQSIDFVATELGPYGYKRHALARSPA